MATGPGRVDVAVLRDRWTRHALDWHGEGRSDEIAADALRDVPVLVDEVERLQLIETKAAGLVRTAHPTDVDKREVVRQWWDGLREALGA